MSKKRILIACEFSGIVREAFRKKGWRAVSCDLLKTEIPGEHYKGDIMDILYFKWDMMIGHPPCTYTAVSGARWFKHRKKEQYDAIEFFKTLFHAPIEKICLEHPVSVISTKFRRPDQYIQPWMFGHGEVKKTGLWLKNIPKLQPTDIVSDRIPRVHHEPPRKDRWKRRSRTYKGIAQAMADQWG